MKNHHHEKNPHHSVPHAPGTGSDHHHPETPDDADARFKKQTEKEAETIKPTRENAK